MTLETLRFNEKNIKKDKRDANQVKKILRKNNIFTINLLGSPGAGKTSILEKVIERLGQRGKIAVIEGDLYTNRDGIRLKKYGTQVVQVNTEGISHLEPGMIIEALNKIDLKKVELLLIENVGNLVSTANYDLGEDVKVTVLSVPEGSDKLLKYPYIFQKAEIMILNKIDLIPYTSFSINEIKKDLIELKDFIHIYQISCENGAGIDDFCYYLQDKVRLNKSAV